MAKNLVLNSWIDEYAELMAKESFKILESICTAKGEGVDTAVSLRFINYFLGILVYNALSEHRQNKNMTNNQAYEFTRQNLSDIKMGIQNQVASGFEEAFLKYTGKQVEYYCIIKPTPEVANRYPI